MEKLNRAQVEAIFTAEAVLMGTKDGLPISKAREIFGGDAVDFAQRMSNTATGTYSNGYGIGDYTAFYLTLTGAMIAATYNNIAAIRAAEAEAGIA